MSDKLLEKKLELQSAFKSGSGWFFWIAGLSIINSVVFYTGGDFGFIFGLGITQIIDGMALAEDGSFSTIALFFNAIAMSSFLVIGNFARRRMKRIYVGGMVLYALDGLIFLMISDWLSIGFHAFALFGMFSGYKAMSELELLEEQIKKIDEIGSENQENPELNS